MSIGVSKKKYSFIGTIMILYHAKLEKLCWKILKDYFSYSSFNFGSVCPKLMLHYILSKYGRIFYDREKRSHIYFFAFGQCYDAPATFPVFSQKN